MSVSISQRDGLLSRLRTALWRRPAEPSAREAIAELIQGAQDGEPEDRSSGGTPGAELDRHERVLLTNVLRLRETSAYDVMVPRADIVAIRLDTPLDDAIAQIRSEGHSRLPVYREQLDDIVGMVHIKDVYAYAGRPEAFSLSTILRRPLMVAPQIPVLDLLVQMRQARMHLALVVDEYGGIDGLVTIEDLVETIVGDISDEHDEPDQAVVTDRGDGTFDMDARVPLEEFVTRLGDVLTEEERHADIDTIGGLVFNLAERVPAKGEVLTHPSGVEFRVLDADARHIRKLRVRKPGAVREAAE